MRTVQISRVWLVRVLLFSALITLTGCWDKTIREASTKQVQHDASSSPSSSPSDV